MRKASLMLLALLPVLLLSGCSASRQVEHQAYVIAMGVDSLPDGRIELSVQIPRISGGQESSGGSSGSSGSYMPLSVSAAAAWSVWLMFLLLTDFAMKKSSGKRRGSIL